MRIPLVVLAIASLALSGCALNNTATPSKVTGAALQGNVHGGQQPVAGAHIYLFTPGASGYGGNGIPPENGCVPEAKKGDRVSPRASGCGLNASVSVFTEVNTGLSDSVGPYILTTAGGNFTFPTYTCTPGAQLYLYVLGGNPGGGTNSALGMMAALGACGSDGAIDIPFISVNEITTVAAAYALAGFASDATHISTGGSTLAQTGIANAFANASNLVNVQTGAALATTPAGNGTVPQNELLTLADILAYCVNSNDTTSGNSSTISSNCSTLFGYTLSGGTTGTTPTDTATAAINIAHNPGANVSNLFPLATPKSPYAVSGTYNQPNDFTVAIGFTGGGINGPAVLAIDGSGGVWVPNFNTNTLTYLSSKGAPASGSPFSDPSFNDPYQAAIDLTGNVWISNYGANAVTELTSGGVAVSGSPFSAGGINEPGPIAIDGSNSVWTVNGDSTVTKLSNSGTPALGSPFSQTGMTIPLDLAIDSYGNAWVPDFGSGKLYEFTTAGATATNSPFSAGGLSSCSAIAIDSGNDTWTSNYYNGTVTVLSNNGTPVAGSPFSGGGLTNADYVAIDGAGNVWFANYNSITELSATGIAISPSQGYTGTVTVSLTGLALDGSGDVWVSDYRDNLVAELIGASTPVVTPVAYAVSTNQHGTRP